MISHAEDEHVVLVDPDGTVLGTAPKLASHHAKTPLHLAFSCYIFNEHGQFLVTQRAHHKKVWPGVWTNSCCGHLALNESSEQAMSRRAQYELGMRVKDLQVLLPDYQYITPPFNGIVDHEICPVYVARANSLVHANPEEVADYAWVSWDEYIDALNSDKGDTWSWWAKDQLKHIVASKAARDYIALYSVPIK